MAVFTNKRQVGTTLPMIVETPEHIIIEGQSYDKATLNPVMLKPMMYHNHDGINNMIMNRSWIRATGKRMWASARDGMGDPSFMKWDGGAGIAKQVWESKFDPNSFFIFASFTDHNICKIDKNSLKIVNMLNQNSHGYGQWYNTQTQNGEFYYTFTNSFIWRETPNVLNLGISNFVNWYNFDGNRRAGSYFAASLFDKSSWAKTANLFVMTNHINYCDGNSQLLHVSSNYAFYGIGGNNCTSNDNYAPDRTENRQQNTLIYCLDLTTKAITQLFAVSADTYGNPSTGFSVPFSDSLVPTKKYTYYAVPTTSANFLKIYRGYFDENSPLTTKGVTQCTINFTNTPFTLGTTHKGFTTATWDNRTTYLRTSTFTSNTNRYLVITLLRSSDGAYTQNEPLTTYNTYIFRLSTDGLTLTPLQILSNDDYPLEIFPMDPNYQRVMMIYPNYIAFWAWNSVTEQYSVVNTFAVAAYGVGMDDLDRLWVYDSVGQLHLMTPFIPASVDITYAAASYNYQGVPIPTSINVNAYDTSHARIARSITLTIEGTNCEFQDSSKIKTITTSNTTDTNISINITGAGYFRIVGTIGV